MRSVVAFATSAALAAAVAGCSSLEGTYIREGIGVNLSSSDLPEATRLQDIYVGEICRQAGLRVAQRGDVLLCDEIDMKPAEWATFVQAGMNDIDRRCDAYLTWLDNKRRSREPILKQLNTTAAATAAILGLTGAGEVPIAIVAQAFLFAQDSFTNFQSRLITDIDHTVIQSVVLDHQNKFRDKIAAVPVDNRPAAIYLLRNYLRICMPMSIEMSISETVTTFHRGGADALRPDPLLTRPPGVAAHVATAVPLTGRTPLIKTTPGTSTSLSGAVTPEERNMTTDILKKIQALLCAPRDGAFGLKTREGIRMFQSTLGTGAATGQINSRDAKVILDKASEKGAACAAQYRTYYERSVLKTPEAIMDFQLKLNSVMGSGMNVTVSGVLDLPTRTKIETVRAILQIAEDVDRNLVTQELLSRLEPAPPPPPPLPR